MNTRAIILGFSLVVSTALMSEANIPIGDFSAKLSKMAGEQGQFYVGKEDFPKDYFLVPNNLPFLAGLSLHHPMSSTLNLSDEQIKAIQEIKKRTIPPVVKSSQDIKRLELKLAQNIAIDTNTAESQYEIVDAIGKLRIALTKAHLQCINDVRAVLTAEQYTKLLAYGANNKADKGSSKDKPKVHELVSFIRGGIMVKSHGDKLGITDAQASRFANEILMGFVPKIQKAMKRANELDAIIKKGVYIEKKSSKDLAKEVAELAAVKTEATNNRIEAFLVLRDILSKEQFEKGWELIK